jgi:hypothetical protein
VEPTKQPLWLVIGNCQAEALRILLDAVPDRPYRTVRVPPVHELQRRDLPYLERLLADTAVLACQPIRSNYRDLPIGTTDLIERLPAAASVVRWPVIRYAGLYPFQVIVRRPADRSVNPPAVPYHDLRTIAAAREGRGPADPWDVEVAPERFRAVAEASRAALALRESRDTDVGVSDLLAAHGADAAHAINHPGNPVLVDLARRILESRGLRLIVSTPAEALLGSVYVPLEQRVLSALGIDAAPRSNWSFQQQTLTPTSVHATQLAWYQDNWDFIELTEARHGETMDLLGLAPTRRSS